MLACLQNTVKLLELCDTRIEGEYYVNDIPYLSEGAFAYLRDAETETAQAVFDSVERSALSSMYGDLFQRAQSKIKLVSKTRSVYSSEWMDTKAVIPVENKLKGWCIDLEKYQELTLNSFELRSAVALENETLYVFDLYSGLLLDSFTFSLAAGPNTITLDTPKKYSSRKGLFIAYDANNIDSWENSTYGFINGSQCPCPCSGGGGYEIEISGLVPDMSIFQDSLTGISHNGININYHLACSYDLLFCDQKALLIEALRHKIALVYFQKSSGVGAHASPANMISGEVLEGIKSHLKDEYDKQINTFFTIVKPDGQCFRCTAPVEIVRQLP